MTATDAARFTVGVFQDIAWAKNGIAALLRAGLLPESLSLLALASAEASALIEEMLPGAGETLHVAGLGEVVARGPLVPGLQGTGRDLETLGLSGTMRRIGFQPHDARIFDALTARGGVLVAIHSEPRAADALAVLHAYGGGNAAIGAWTGRV
jgi:hypothetical protein